MDVHRKGTRCISREITRIIYVSGVWEEHTLILGSHPWLGWEKSTAIDNIAITVR